MSRHAPATLLSLRVALLLPVVLVLTACGLQYDATINKDETVNITTLTWGSSITKKSCETNTSNPDSAVSRLNANGIDWTYTYTNHDGESACRATATNVPFDKFKGSKMTFGHADGTYTVDIDLVAEPTEAENYGADTSVSVVFPGDVVETTGVSVETNGNKVTWTDLSLEKSNQKLHASGKDKSAADIKAEEDKAKKETRNKWIWIVGGVMVVAAVAASLFAVISRSRRQQRLIEPQASSPYTEENVQAFQQPPSTYTQSVPTGQIYTAPNTQSQPAQPYAPTGSQPYPASPQPYAPTGSQPYPASPQPYAPTSPQPYPTSPLNHMPQAQAQPTASGAAAEPSSPQTDGYYPRNENPFNPYAS